DDLLITDDNVFGTPREDAFRRDFTINALFYNIADYSVIDYVGGIEDLERRLLRVIGEPEVRFREDPIRMTRACELAGRLGLSIESETQRAIYEQREELLKAAPARLTEELLGILRSGRAGATVQWMLELGLVDVALPEVRALLEVERLGLGRYGEVLPVLDERVAAGNEPSEIGLLSALLIGSVVARRQREQESRGKRLRGEPLRQVVLDEITPFFQRLTLARAKAEQVAQTMVTLDRIRSESWSETERLRLAQRAWFPDLLLLLEIVARAEGDERGDLEAWRRVAANRPPAEERRRRRPRGRGRPRRRRARPARR
ncbi:MAG: hypothetical protein R3325_15100, partial [Thermoanaerobaculia bacterium]|nr:hypothetical protein [Thermoanaerobaculia bacterium]